MLIKFVQCKFLQALFLQSLTPRSRKSKPAPPPPLPEHEAAQSAAWLATAGAQEKLSKDQANRTTQSLGCTPITSPADKWKRKKGPAPALPTPFRRKVSQLLSFRKKLFSS